MSHLLIVVGLAVTFQLTAATLALRLIPLTGKRAAWSLVAAALVLMTVRRAESLAAIVGDHQLSTESAAFEIVGLAISVLLVAGIYKIRPVFAALLTANRDLSLANDRMRTLSTDLEKSLANVRTLTGMLPICAACKKIRDDKGYWNQIESYVRDHSEAEFSHGLCPECARRLYPDILP
ncbi:MAG: hypothetical protein HY903_03260 [Deltaproteobacteria bacterium]|nr:hypothetical protein [Deltaproteobacteria bacterium]